MSFRAKRSHTKIAEMLTFESKGRGGEAGT